jgi:outer membrane protein, adhesin transport system
VVNVYLDQFALDRRTLLDVLDSQNELFVSRSNHVNALYTEMFAVFRIMALQGMLLKTLNLPRPREARVENN